MVGFVADTHLSRSPPRLAAVLNVKPFVAYRGETWWGRWKDLTGVDVPPALCRNKSHGNVLMLDDKRLTKKKRNLKGNVVR
jgi:hypothetical protein